MIIKILLITISISSSKYRFIISEDYIVKEITNSSLYSNSDVFLKYIVLDKKSGMVHKINSNFQARETEPFDSAISGGWMLAGTEVLSNEIIGSEEYLGLKCIKIQEIRQVNHEFLGGDNESRIEKLYADLPIVKKYVANIDYLPFLSIYKPNITKEPYDFEVKAAMQLDFAQNFTMFEVQSIEEKEFDESFFSKLLNVTLKKE